MGGDAEPAESDHFLSNNLKSCGVEGARYRREGAGGPGCVPVQPRTMCQITMSGYVNGELRLFGRRGSGMQSGLHVRAGRRLHVHQRIAAPASHTSKAAPPRLHPHTAHVVQHTHTGGMQRNYCFSGFT